MPPVQVEAACDQSAVERTEAEVQQVWSEITAAASQGRFSTQTGPLCGWCNFKSTCPAFAGGDEGT